MLGYKNKKMIPDNVYMNHFGYSASQYNYNSYYLNNYSNQDSYINYYYNSSRQVADSNQIKWNSGFRAPGPYRHQATNYPSYNMYKNYFNFPSIPHILSSDPTAHKVYSTENNSNLSLSKNDTSLLASPRIATQKPEVQSNKVNHDWYRNKSNTQEYRDSEYQFVYGKEKKVKRCGVIFIIKTPDNIIENFKILVVKGVSGIWSFPKGRCMPNEEEEACAKREVYEETGLEIDNLKDKKKFKIGRNIYFKYDCVENQFTNFTVHDTNEVEEVSWKSIKELRQIVCNKDIRSLLNYQNRLYTYHTNVFN